MITFEKELFERIYLAKYGDTSEYVIVKYFIRDPTMEFRIISGLHHPNLVKYFSLYYEKAPENPSRCVSRPLASESIFLSPRKARAIIMEHCAAGDLYDYFLHQSVPMPMIRNILKQLASVLVYLHRAGIAHRDVKLENIFLRDDPAKENSIVLGDFELMSRWSPDSILTQVVGTLYYQAPELFTTQKYLGPELDVWSTGIVLYTLLTGGFPFHDDDDDMAVHKILKNPLDIPANLPEAAKDLVTRMLDKNQATRISMEQVLEHPFLTDDTL